MVKFLVVDIYGKEVNFRFWNFIRLKSKYLVFIVGILFII